MRIAPVSTSGYPTKAKRALNSVLSIEEKPNKLFRETMSILDRITPVPQDEGSALYYSKQQDVLLGDRRYFTRAESIARMKQNEGERSVPAPAEPRQGAHV